VLLGEAGCFFGGLFGGEVVLFFYCFFFYVVSIFLEEPEGIGMSIEVAWCRSNFCATF
jgi:hypothetical protein